MGSEEREGRVHSARQTFHVPFLSRRESEEENDNEALSRNVKRLCREVEKGRSISYSYIFSSYLDVKMFVEEVYRIVISSLLI